MGKWIETALLDVYYWTLRESYRTWIAHALLAVALSPIVGPWAVMVFYVFREIEQVVVTWMYGLEEQDWLDHFLDVSAAFVATGLYSLIA